MAKLFSSPDAPTAASNVTAELPISGGYSNAAGQLLYSTTLGRMFGNADFDSNATSYVLSNAGTIWVDFAAGAEVLSVMNLGSIVNSGTIVAHSSGGVADALSVTSSFATGLTNSGSIYALSDTSNALAVSYWSSGADLFNSGIIAAAGATGATTIYAANGGEIVNSASGSILAEGNTATAVFLGRGHYQVPGFPPAAVDLVNYGRIEAHSTDPYAASVAIYSESLQSESVVIENHGTIRADVAIYSVGGAITAQESRQWVDNADTGVIEGQVFLGYGDDTIVNAGLIDGYVDLSDGDDLFDNSAGIHIGDAELGWGNDRYIGGSATDVVTADRGDDDLSGGDGNDLLIGGWGNDLLAGGAGNDGIYGEGGNDRISTAGGDVVEAGIGDDIVELGDYRFASIDGGGGFDTLMLPADGRILSLSATLASGRVSGFEKIALASNGRLVVHASDIMALTGGPSLYLSGDPSATVDLAGTWVKGANKSVGGISFATYTSGGATLYVQSGVAANLGSDPTNAIGLDAVADGGDPLVPGSVPGAELTQNVVIVSGVDFTGTLEIFEPEQWISADGSAIIAGYYGSSGSVINRGTMESYGGELGAVAIAGFTFGRLENYGTITGAAFSGTGKLADNKAAFNTYGLYNMVDKPYNAFGVGLGGSAENFLNAGLIEASSDQVIATGYMTYGAPGQNIGTISATSTNFIAVGVHTANGGTLVNDGIIQATGSWGAYGVSSATHASTIINSGSIFADATEAGRESIGIYFYYAHEQQRVINSGTITADIAIQTSYTVNGNSVWLYNSGEINGRIQLGSIPAATTAREDVILNAGTIKGVVELGGGRDVYDGTHGVQVGAVRGQDGNDLLIGTAAGDTLDGGNGDDVLIGGSGDTLTGGAGRDTFVLPTYSAGGAAVSITDFVSGTDKIDLRSLAPTSVTLSGLTLQAVTANGTLTVNISGSIKLSDVILTGGTTAGTLGDDVLIAGGDVTSLSGSDGFDLLVGSAGNDILEGGLAGTVGTGEAGDVMWGGAGDDTYRVDARNDLVIESEGGGTDTIEIVPGYYQMTFVMPDHVENLRGGSGVGNDQVNLMSGGSGADSLDGGGGNDVIAGLGGGDTLGGGAGSDHFVYAAVSDSTASAIDSIADFEHGADKIDLSALTVTSIRFEQSYWFEPCTNLIVDTTAGQMTIRVNDFVDMSDLITTAAIPVQGSGGADSLVGGSASDWLNGLNGNDWLNGGAGSDTLHGDAGDDGLIGGGGFDLLTGGAGADRFYLNGLADSADRISDFEAVDRIYLDTSVFTGLAGGVLTPTTFRFDGEYYANDTRISYNSSTGELFYDADGLGTVSGVRIALLAPGTVLTASSFVLYSGNPQTIESNVSRTLGAGEFDLVLTGTDAINGTGNSADNQITGNLASNRLTGLDGADRLSGMAGNDVLSGGEGVDLLDGGEGSDLYLMASASEHGAAEIADSGADGIDEVRYSATTPGTLTLFAGDTGIEKIVVGTGTGPTAALSGTTALNVDARLLTNAVTVVGNSGANTLQATAYADVLQGGVGVDRLYGYAGNDTLDGGRDADAMLGGTGDDTYIVDHSSDALVEVAGEGTDTAVASVAYTLRANVENLVQSGVLSISGSGNALDNSMTGNSGSNKLYGLGGNDTIIGAAGNDTLDGGGGDDTLVGGAGNDVYGIDSAGDRATELAGEGTDRINASISYTLGDYFEQLTLLGSSAIDGTGNGLANVIKGNDGANILSGLVGNDKLYGGLGDDIVLGGEGSDWIEGGAGADQLSGGSGSDRFVFRAGDFGGATQAAADIIRDFSRAEGDKIRLDLADADSTVAGIQDFVFIGTGSFTGVAGQLRYDQSGGNTMLWADTDGDLVADVAIQVDGLHSLVASDFIF
ncbi:M10 family metallopeptidase C-terminal domain-containing protein [Sphingomonas rhizophila]|uniref:M10 family metallopeptidase C-terminal domain-containing protein n=1 Tax=Sphingomonas rhizophila TaxID=2071607 RepID=A0A7G9SBS6_9SPHN|nr:M10 family metallopeptidase C-terminal domain-containing protein [Sphingomonas rhizophila]QNN65301.1 M10 family metallopeptidase C-terminal domain-containing protein [Sphingomonas rhizophila]